MAIIQKTTNYSQFNKYPSNRKVHPEKLIESIKKKDMLESHPILVTKDKYIIDGQHRLEAAKFLKIPIYFTIVEDLEEKHIPLCQVQRPWKLEEFLHFYQDFNEHYKFLNELLNEFALSLHFVVHITNSNQISAYNDFRTGNYRVTKDKVKLKDKFKLFSEIKYSCEKIIKHKITKSFSEAVWRIMGQVEDEEHGAYAHERFMQSIDSYPEELIDCNKFKSSEAIYANLIDNVYNRNLKDKKKTLRINKTKVCMRKFKNVA